MQQRSVASAALCKGPHPVLRAPEISCTAAAVASASSSSLCCGAPALAHVSSASARQNLASWRRLLVLCASLGAFCSGARASAGGAFSPCSFISSDSSRHALASLHSFYGNSSSTQAPSQPSPAVYRPRFARGAAHPCPRYTPKVRGWPWRTRTPLATSCSSAQTANAQTARAAAAARAGAGGQCRRERVGWLSFAIVPPVIHCMARSGEGPGGGEWHSQPPTLRALGCLCAYTHLWRVLPVLLVLPAALTSSPTKFEPHCEGQLEWAARSSMPAPWSAFKQL